MKLYAGVDPGRTGGLVVIDERGNHVAHTLMPIVGKGTRRARVCTITLDEWWGAHVRPRLNGWRPTVAIERVHARPDDGPIQAFRFGVVTGAVFAWAECGLYASIMEVSPKDWQNVYLRGHPKSSRDEIKASAALVASERFPELRKDLQVKARWGLADAALIAATARAMEIASSTSL